MSAPRRHIGSTDVAAVLGVSKYRSAWNVQQRILRGVEQPVAPQLLRGLALEAGIARRFAELSGNSLRSMGRIEHPHGRAWQAVNFDYECGDIVECKSASEWAIASWGPEPDGLILDYVVQTQTQMEAADRPATWVPVLIVPGDLAEIEGQLSGLPEADMRRAIDGLVPLYLARGELRIYRVERDREMGEVIVDACARWWDRHIVRQEPCEPTATNGLAEYLRDAFPLEREPLRDAAPTEVRLMLDYEEARRAREAAAGRVDDIGAALRLAIADAAGVRSVHGVATLKAEKGRTDWRAVANELRAMLGLHGVSAQDVIPKHTAANGSRKLTVRLAERAEQAA